jgi:alpha-glucosidase
MSIPIARGSSVAGVLRSGLSLLILPTLLTLSSIVVTTPTGAQEWTVTSPSGRLTVTIEAGTRLTWRVDGLGRELLHPSVIDLELADTGRLGHRPRFSGEIRDRVDRVLTPVVPERSARIEDRYTSLLLQFGDSWSLEVRAYDSGVAYRFLLHRPGERVRVVDETVEFRFADDPELLYAAEESFFSHQERVYERGPLTSFEADRLGSPPALVRVPDGPSLVVTEADLRAYPGLWLQTTGETSLRGVLPRYPRTTEQVRDRDVPVRERHEHLAVVDGERSLPWRVLIVAEDDAALLGNTLVWQLAAENRIDDPTWIRPGKVAWDWWNALNLEGVGFRTGVNTETYRYYIDFAADHGIEYVILDEGWYRLGDLFDIDPEVDLAALLTHARERGVGIILWVVWKTLDDRFAEAMAWFEELGIAGLKVDFMQRDDQPMVEYYWKVAEEAARRHLVVDFHGAYKPAGLRRAWPNVLTREGVLGQEHSKWAERPTPEHDVTLPFVRMVAGPMDFTPGAMRNAHPRQFRAVFDRPMSLGTRCHQLAMYVVFESPLQMLCDTPTSYEQEEECLALLADVPTVWARTVPLAGAAGDYVAVARQSLDGTWYLAAMNDESERVLEVDVSFLGEGEAVLEVFADGVNADRDAEDYRRRIVTHDTADPLPVRMAPGGGWVARVVGGAGAGEEGRR